MSSATSDISRRNRSILSCSQCRQAKSKCDRQSPCGTCHRRGRADQCTFPLPVTRKKAALSLQKRLKTLESIVKDVMENYEIVTAKSTSSATLQEAPMAASTCTVTASNLQGSSVDSCSFEEVQRRQGHVVFDDNESRYMSSTHWKTLLENVGEVSRLLR